MLTRIEINGFKTFRSFALDVPTFLVVLGRNASGKSNLFDVIQFLSRLAGHSVVDAVQGMRGEADELFHRRLDGTSVDRMTFVVELLLDPTVADPYGDQVTVRHTRVRYKVVVERRTTGRENGRLFIAEEEASLIRRHEDRWVQRRSVDSKFRSRHLKYSSRSSPELLETAPDDTGRPAFWIRQEGHAGRPRQLPATMAETTVLSSITTTEFPLLYALRRELQSWRFLQLDPGALRQPSSFRDLDRLSSDGTNLAAVLHRIKTETATDDRPSGALADISADLARLVPGMTGVRVLEDLARRQWQLELLTRDEAPYSARVASDGTLRLLALLSALYDPQFRGLICFEEPENGIYPQRLTQFIEYLRTLVTDPGLNGSEDQPLAQLLLSSHSPKVLDATPAENVVFSDTATRVEKGKSPSRVTRFRRIRPHDQIALAYPDLKQVVGAAELDSYSVREQLE